MRIGFGEGDADKDEVFKAAIERSLLEYNLQAPLV